MASVSCLLGSSIRSCSVESTLRAAAPYAAALGITRVTDVTRLDRIGIPVCAAIRPNAVKRSLCVHAGKGITPEEARASAMMEAVEFAAAESGASDVSTIPATARDVLDGQRRPEAILDFCPRFQTRISLEAPMSCVEATNLLTGAATLVPAEIVFYPAPPDEPTYFGTTTNGVASGNTIMEATVHGMCETLERDIASFHLVHDRTSLVHPESFPEPAGKLHSMIADAGLDLYVRNQPNDFSLPCFSAVVIDRFHPGAIAAHGGFGCHPHRSIALIRAITEAVQSRLTFIHGGRDDLTMEHELVEGKTEKEVARRNERIIAKASASERITDFDEVPDCSQETGDLQSCFDFLSAKLVERGFRWILQVALTRPDDPVQVVRIIVPGLEIFAKHITRVGPRLGAFANSL